MERWLLDMLARGGVPGWGVDLCLLARERGEWARRFEELGVRILHCPLQPAGTFAWRFLSLLRRERYELVHSHVLYFSGALLSLAAAAGVPRRVAHAHNSRDGRGSGPLRRGYRGAMRTALAASANLVLGCSRGALAQLDSGGAPAKTFSYGVDLDALQEVGGRARGDRADLGFGPHVVIVGSIGRSVPQKNQCFLLDVFKQASKLSSELRLVLAAEGPLRDSLRQRIERLGLSAAVRLLPEGADARRAAASCFDAFVLPSLWEGLPIALLEAQALGLPSLVSDRIEAEAIGIEELVEPFGLEQGVERWAAKLVEAASRPRLAVMEAVGRMRRAGFDAADTGARLAALYDGVGVGARAVTA